MDAAFATLFANVVLHPAVLNRVEGFRWVVELHTATLFIVYFFEGNRGVCG